MKISYQDLIDGNIIGIIDSYGHVRSIFTGDEIKVHDNYWPFQKHNRWRWNWDKSIHWFMDECKLNSDNYDIVMNHLTKQYGIPFWDNGHHDIEFMMKERDKQEGKNNS